MGCTSPDPSTKKTPIPISAPPRDHPSPGATMQLFATSYAGTVATLALTLAGHKNATLQQVAADHSCGAMPSWLTLDGAARTLYCANEAAAPNGSLAAYAVGHGGALALEANATTRGGDVFSHVLDGFIALAEYETSAVSTFTLPIHNDSKAAQSFTFTMAKPGPVPDRQDKPHPHQATCDPTGDFILAPDLGADLIRIFAVDAATRQLTEQEPYAVAPGSGPRHVDFYSPSGDPRQGSVMYLTSELANTVSSFDVAYKNGTISISKLQDPVKPYPNGTAPSNATSYVGEVHVRGTTLTVSNRGDESFGPGRDSLAVFDLAHNGKFTFRRLYDAGGNYPRTFVINRAGTMIASGLQMSNSVAVLPRDPKTGAIGQALATVKLDGQVSSVIWNE